MEERRIRLEDEARTVAVDHIKQYFSQERDEDLGDLAAGFILDFLLETVGPSIYNQGLDDAQAWFDQRLEDLESDFRSLRLDVRR